MSPSAAPGSASTNDSASEKRSKEDKAKDGVKTNSTSTPTTKSSIFQTITSSFSSSSSAKRNPRQTSSRTSSEPQRSTAQQRGPAKAPAASSSMPPPPVPLSATHSSSSSPGATPKQQGIPLPATSALHSKSDPVLEKTTFGSPRVSVTPPHRDVSPAAQATAPSSSQSTISEGRKRGRGASISTIRGDTAASLIAVPMTRVISNPLPQPTSRAPSPGKGGGRGRSLSHSEHVSSPPGSRSHSPLRELALSFHSFRGTTSQPASPVDTRSGAAADAEKKYWWQARPETPRPWFDEGEQGAGTRAVSERYVPGTATPREHSSLWHRKGSVPSEQSDSWVRTKQRVEAVTTAVLGSTVVDTAIDVTREALEIGQDVLQFAPVAGLAEAARVLVGIWNAVQLVEFNRLQCLRLTERCANILLSVKQEIEEADRLSEEATGSPPYGPPAKVPEGSSADAMKLGVVGYRLKAPLIRLIEAFKQVLEFLDRQNRRPFLKRYLKRDEIQRDLQMCDTALSDALGMFELSIQVRTLEQVLRAEKQQQANTDRLLEHILHTPPYGSPRLPPYQSPHTYSAALSGSPTADNHALESHETQHTSSGESLLLRGSEPKPRARHLDSLGLHITPIDDAPDRHPLDTPIDDLPLRPHIPETVPSSAPQVRSTLAELTQWQNAYDSIRDLADLRQMLRRARDDDSEMARLLQVRPEEAPEALKALQRALEEEITREREEREREEREHATLVHEGSEQEISVGSTQGILDGIVGHASSASREVLGPSLSHKQEPPESRRSSLSHVSTVSSSMHTSQDTLDREFIESAKDSLVRLSIASGRPPMSLALPSWTITRYEVDLEQQVGHGSFSEVWRGRYRGRIVAVKVLQSWTPREMFLREVHVWNDLRHPNILEMVGASAVEPPCAPGSSTWPWFIVSRYYQRGSLVRWLQHLPSKEWRRSLDEVGKGVLRMIHEIVHGMEYLHGSGILHGDLKCANVLVNDYGHCIISDFGQSEIKSEMHRLSGRQTSTGGTLRWQAPELMAGQSKLTQEMDVYAFAISCYEILTKGEVPWPTADDSSIRHFVLDKNVRPELPLLRPWSGQLADLVAQSWALKPSDRPSFATLSTMITVLRKSYGWQGIEELEPGEAEEEQDWLDWIDEIDKEKQHKSPRLTPGLLPVPELPPDVTEVDESFSSDSYVTAPGATPDHSAADTSSRPPSLRTAMSAPQGAAPHAVPPHTGPTSHSLPGHIHPSESSPALHAPAPSRGASLPSSSSDSESIHLADMLGIPSPAPSDERTMEMRNERRYRMILQHEFHPSLSLPLWSPSPVKVGAVGYHQKPEGTFVTLFDAFRPLETSGGRTAGMPSLAGYGNVTVASQRIEKRNTAQRAIDRVSGIVSRKNVSRRYQSPLRMGHKTAHLFTESAMYHYVADADLAAPRKWFQANVEQVLEIYGTDHAVQREDLMLVIGTLDAQDYALFVSHSHPDGEVDFEVFGRPAPGEPWGKFTTTTDLSESAGPTYRVPGQDTPRVISGSKVSVTKKPGEPWDTVLLARLRFPTDKEEPTSL